MWRLCNIRIKNIYVSPIHHSQKKIMVPTCHPLCLSFFSLSLLSLPLHFGAGSRAAVVAEGRGPEQWRPASSPTLQLPTAAAAPAPALLLPSLLRPPKPRPRVVPLCRCGEAGRGQRAEAIRMRKRKAVVRAGEVGLRACEACD